MFANVAEMARFLTAQEYIFGLYFLLLTGGIVMRRLIGTVGISLLLGSVPLGAFAADMAVKALPPPVPVCEWCGFYIGGNAGGVWSTDSTNFGGDSVAGGTL